MFYVISMAIGVVLMAVFFGYYLRDSRSSSTAWKMMLASSLVGAGCTVTLLLYLWVGDRQTIYSSAGLPLAVVWTPSHTDYSIKQIAGCREVVGEGVTRSVVWGGWPGSPASLR